MMSLLQVQTTTTTNMLSTLNEGYLTSLEGIYCDCKKNDFPKFRAGVSYSDDDTEIIINTKFKPKDWKSVKYGYFTKTLIPLTNYEISLDIINEETRVRFSLGTNGFSSVIDNILYIRNSRDVGECPKNLDVVDYLQYIDSAFSFYLNAIEKHNISKRIYGNRLYDKHYYYTNFSKKFNLKTVKFDEVRNV